MRNETSPRKGITLNNSFEVQLKSADNRERLQSNLKPRREVKINSILQTYKNISEHTPTINSASFQKPADDSTQANEFEQEETFSPFLNKRILKEIESHTHT